MAGAAPANTPYAIAEALGIGRDDPRWPRLYALWDDTMENAMDLGYEPNSAAEDAYVVAAVMSTARDEFGV